MHAAVQSVQIPGLSVSDVLVQYKRLILGEDTHGIDSRIDAVRQRKIDNTILSTKRNCRFCQLLRQCVETRALTAGKQHCNHFFCHKIPPILI